MERKRRRNLKYRRKTRKKMVYWKSRALSTWWLRRRHFLPFHASVHEQALLMTSLKPRSPPFSMAVAVAKPTPLSALSWGSFLPVLLPPRESEIVGRVLYLKQIISHPFSACKPSVISLDKWKRHSLYYGLRGPAKSAPTLVTLTHLNAASCSASTGFCSIPTMQLIFPSRLPPLVFSFFKC